MTRYLEEGVERAVTLSSPEDVAEFVRAEVGANSRECLMLLCLNDRNRLVCHATVIEGTVDRAPFYPRELVKLALAGNATALLTRGRVAQAINASLVLPYWHIGCRIRRDSLSVRHAQRGKEIFSALSRRLVEEFGPGSSEQNLFRMSHITEVFVDSQIVQTLSAQLGWSHSVEIIPLDEPRTRRC